jgi:CMP/dCMP kinase
MVSADLDEPTRRALQRMVVAMDGPAGSGKSSASRALAEALGLRYLDTGAMYRAVTWRMLLDNVDLADSDAVSARALRTLVIAGTDPRTPTITLDGEDVSRQIRTHGVTAAVSVVSAIPRVREIVVAQQRDLIGAGGIVVEGRDIGTVVAPHAQLKVFLTADPAARAQRRSAEMTVDQARDASAVQADMLRRDTHDSSRVTAPLSQAPDAVPLDTTSMSLADVVSTLVALTLERARTRSA